MNENMIKPLAAVAAHLLGAVPRTLSYLPLSYAISLIRLHQNTGYETYLDTMVGDDVASRNVEGVLDTVSWSGDLQVWTNARLSYWSDLLSVSLSSSCLTWVVTVSVFMAIVHVFLSVVSNDLNALSRKNVESVAVTGRPSGQLKTIPRD